MKTKTLHLLLTFCLLTASNALFAQKVFIAQGASVNFFSETPIENIDATSTSMSSVLNTGNGDILFNVPLRTFRFEKSLMEEHFNEKYVESDKFPKAGFKGKILEEVEWQKDTVMKVSAKGVFSLHGVEREITEAGTLRIAGNAITLDVQFNITLKDYKIEIPSVVSQNIAETIRVTLHSVYMPYVKKK